MVARIRSEPRQYQGHVARARLNTRSRSLAQLQRGGPVLVSYPSTPCGGGFGMIASRSWLCGAKQPAERTRWALSKGTIAASFSNSSRSSNRSLGRERGRNSRQASIAGSQRIAKIFPHSQGLLEAHSGIRARRRWCELYAARRRNSWAGRRERLWQDDHSAVYPTGH